MANKKYITPDGKEVLFNDLESAAIDKVQTLVNDAGYADVDITLLTALEKRISTQKFYTINPEDFLPIVTDTGAWDNFITGFRSYFNNSGDISSWESGTNGENSTKTQGGVGMEPYSVVVHKLNKMLSYSLFELNQSMKTGVYNVVQEKERARKKDYDLAVQKTLLAGDANHKGLLNQTGATVDATTMTKRISAMSSAEFKTFLGKVFASFAKSSEFTALPDTFVVEFSDFLGMQVSANEDFPLKSMYKRVSEAFKEIAGSENATIKHLAYCDAEKRGGTARTVLYRKDFDTIRAYNPIQYTIVNGVSPDGMNYQNTAYASLSDVFLNRPKEVLYMDYTVA